MDIMMKSMQRLMERLIVEQNPPPIGYQDSRGPLCVEKSQTTPEYLQEHMGPPLMVEKEEDK